METQTAVNILISAANKWGDMLEGFRERGLLVQMLKDEADDYRARISEAAETVREATRCSQR